MDDSIKKQDIKCDIMEKLEEQVFKISRLIFKEVTGTISDEEQRYLEWWRGRNPDNERLYRELKDGQRVMGEVKQLEGVEVIRPLEGMHLRIREEERRLRQRRWQWLPQLLWPCSWGVFICSRSMIDRSPCLWQRRNNPLKPGVYVLF